MEGKGNKERENVVKPEVVDNETKTRVCKYGGDLGSYRSLCYSGTGVSVEGAKREGGNVLLNQGVGKNAYTWRLEGRGMKIELRGGAMKTEVSEWVHMMITMSSVMENMLRMKADMASVWFH